MQYLLPLLVCSQLITLKDVPSGSYVLTIDGSKITLKETVIFTLQPSPDPEPDPTSPVAKAVRLAAQKLNDPETASELAVIYQKLSEQDIDSVEALTFATKWATDRLLKEKNIPLTTWEPVRQVIGGYWLAYQQEGKSVGDFKKLMQEVAIGLSFDKNQRLDLVMILKIIEMILAILAELF